MGHEYGNGFVFSQIEQYHTHKASFGYRGLNPNVNFIQAGIWLIQNRHQIPSNTLFLIPSNPCLRVHVHLGRRCQDDRFAAPSLALSLWRRGNLSTSQMGMQFIQAKLVQTDGISWANNTARV
jgi:hypothetical protein